MGGTECALAKSRATKWAGELCTLPCSGCRRMSRAVKRKLLSAGSLQNMSHIDLNSTMLVGHINRLRDS